MKSILLTTLGFLIWSTSFAQWTQVNSIPSQSMSAIANMGNTLYVASGSNLLFKSTDAGITWNSITVSTLPMSIFTLKVIDNVIYIGTTDNGIFTSTDFGATWTNYNSSLHWVSGFAKFNNKVYASTSGSGVYRYDPINNNWTTFNNQLPVGWGYSVETIVTTSNKLLIGAGGNGTFFNYDFSADRWLYGYYYGQNKPGLVIQKIINQSDTLFAVDGRRLLRSNNGGLSWTEDHIGSRNGLTRVIFSGSTHMYILTNLFGGNGWIQKRNKNSVPGTSWATDEELFQTLYLYDIFEFNNKLFLATNEGLYVKDLIPGINEPNNPMANLQLFPNPSNGKTINVTCDKNIDSYTITNSLGQNVYSKRINKNVFTIDKNLQQGVYYVSVYLSNGGIVAKKVVVN